MYLKSIELTGFKSFGRKTELVFGSRIAAIVGPNGSGKSNTAEGFRFVLGEQSMKAMRGKRGEDMIWGGSPTFPRAGRAAVKVVFDNTPVNGVRLLDVDFPEVVVERVVHRDGLNEYLLNGTQVRLKDVIRLLAGANIGGSGYQIISQGEADRILNASPKERREMVEDALGLKLFQHKKHESERKLEETANNIEKTRSLRREIGPHLNFLRQQVEKIEKARELKDELSAQLSEYLAREHAWITQEDARLKGELEDAEGALNSTESRLKSLPSASGAAPDTSALDRQLSEMQGKAGEARAQRERIARELGRAEGAHAASTVVVEQLVPAPQVRQFAREIETEIENLERENDLGRITQALAQLRGRIASFIEGLTGVAPVTSEETRMEVERLTKALIECEQHETAAQAAVENVRAQIREAREAVYAAQRDAVELRSLLREQLVKRDALQAARAQIAQARTRFEDEVREGIALIGAAVHSWENGEIPEGALSEDRTLQEKRRRAIERLKIKIEESGTGNSEAVLREYKQTKERDEYLAKELIDLEQSAISLKNLIAELDETIDKRFEEGLYKINDALQNFFVKLFGGGSAKLSIDRAQRAKTKDDESIDDEEMAEPEEEVQPGISIAVSLPRKKIRGLEVLSGGERALTSIALIFSMTQVNPPPFLILDETDAALDEANSKRYADMIRELGAHSQLIVITHNRATMAAAGELFGVTMGSDGVSKLLSVKLEEAERVAK
jgi:chromosome segregation protein